MRAVFDFEELTATRCKLLVLPDDLFSALRSKKVIVTECVSYREVDTLVSKSVRSRHRVPHKEGELEGHYFNDLQDSESGEHMNLIINN